MGFSKSELKIQGKNDSQIYPYFLNGYENSHKKKWTKVLKSTHIYENLSNGSGKTLEVPLLKRIKYNT